MLVHSWNETRNRDRWWNECMATAMNEKPLLFAIHLVCPFGLAHFNQLDFLTSCLWIGTKDGVGWFVRVIQNLVFSCLSWFLANGRPDEKIEWKFIFWDEIGNLYCIHLDVPWISFECLDQLEKNPRLNKSLSFLYINHRAFIFPRFLWTAEWQTQGVCVSPVIDGTLFVLLFLMNSWT